MAAYVGLRGGVRGAVASYAGFGLPAFLLMLRGRILFRSGMPLWVSCSMASVMVVAIVANATFRFGREIGRKPVDLPWPASPPRYSGSGEPVRGHRRRGVRGAFLFRIRVSPLLL